MLVSASCDALFCAHENDSHPRRRTAERRPATDGNRGTQRPCPLRVERAGCARVSSPAGATRRKSARPGSRPAPSTTAVTLVDTSVWVDHFRGRTSELAHLLTERRVHLHPFVFGELLLGAMPPNPAALEEMRALWTAPVATDDEVVSLIQSRSLNGRGIGYLDAHLLVSAILIGDSLWTLDTKLRSAAEHLSIVVGP